MNWRKFADDYFTFSRRDRIAIISLIVLLSGVLFIPRPVHTKPVIKEVPTQAAWEEAADMKQAESGSSNKKSHVEPQAERYYPGKKLFFFDPNTASDEDLKLLGFRTKTISIIRHYLDRGGRFRQPADLKKIYGLFDDEFERVRPFVKIPALVPSGGSENPRLHALEGQRKAEIENSNPDIQKSFITERKSFPGTYSKNPGIIDINITDTNELKRLPGIGSRLSQRIINFREKLGGFYSVEQVSETFGLPDSVYQKIKPYLVIKKAELKKLNINTATADQLKAHPYIRYPVANAIITYRDEHGMFKSTADLKNIMTISHDIFQKILPYVTVE